MSFQLAFAALLAIGTVTAAPAASLLSTSITSDETCITRIRPASTTLSSLPTSTRTSAQTVTTTLTVAGSAGYVTESETASALTSTIVVNATEPSVLDATGAARTSTIFATVTPANGTAGAGSCSETTTVSADATTTVYTGSYSGSVAKRTAGVLDRRSSISQKRQDTLAGVLSHMFGQTPVGGAREPFEVDCLEQVTTYLVATSTASATLLTTTVTTSAPVVYVTSTRSLSTVEQASASQSVVTVTSTVTAQSANNGTSSGVCTVTTGKATATTTQHLKCAATNLVSEIDGYGIGSIQGHANETQGLAPGSDPSACCQLCVDTEGCAASEDDQKAGNCFLWYTTTPTCGLGFTYANGGKNLAAGAGFLVQSGCGTIEAASS
ncbi:hypothetical protein LTR36_002455 [Oleoguttula mirabilis]|uniref:Ca2+-modulated nonselective cation channel polycystin n=1 Tax=Oleoguttula mirabilis TaxID=1507867 RepID=A0AAV9JKP1_9PEZI|nr:hypothetical protein LTR36_002455 [Oleoguttula mirabilis]